MADPVTMGLAVVGGGLKAFGAYQEGKAQSNMYKYQAGVARVNADIAKQNADYTRMVGEQKQWDVGVSERFKMGKAKAIQGASNLDVNKGSAAAVRESMGELSRTSQLRVREAAVRRAYGYDIDAAKDTAQAGAYEQSAKSAKAAGTINAISSLIGTATTVSGKWGPGATAGSSTSMGGIGSDYAASNRNMSIYEDRY